MITAMICEKSFEIYLIDAVLIFRKAYCAKQAVISILSKEKSTMNTAKIYEVESSPAHYEKCFKITAFLVFLAIGDLGEVIDLAALITELELAYANQFFIYGSGIGEQIGLIFYIASQADLFLLEL